MADTSLDGFEQGSSGALGAARRVLPFAVGLLLLAGIAWFVYTQMTAVRGVKVEAPPPQAVEMLPPPPPPPPPPPTPQEKPPEPTEQPQPAPASEAPKTPQPQAAAPVSIAGAPQAGSDAFGLSAGSGGGIGAPGGGGTCLGTNCGTGGGGGGGMSEAFYRRYLSGALQERVQDDDRISRLVFSADFSLSVASDGRITGVQFLEGRSGNNREVAQKLIALLQQVRGLDPPPAGMRFPQRITVRGKRAL